MLLTKSGKARFDALITASIENNKALSERDARRFLHVSCLHSPGGRILIYQQRNHISAGNEVAQQPEALSS